MANPHLEIIRAAIAANVDLGTLFGSVLGSRAHPRGQVLSAYRAARSALRGAVNTPAAGAVLRELKAAVLDAVAGGGRQAVSIGVGQAERNAEALGLAVRTWLGGETLTGRALAAIGALLDAQAGAVQSGLLTEAQVIGGEGAAVGLLTPTVVQREAANQFAALAGLGLAGTLFPGALLGGGEAVFRRQAIAAIDGLTTPCCLGVHGQVVGMDEPFTTTGPPAYARQQDRPPFHHRCRTATALVMVEMAGDDLTEDMLRAAALEAQLRGTAGYSLPDYISAFTRIRP